MFRSSWIVAIAIGLICGLVGTGQAEDQAGQTNGQTEQKQPPTQSALPFILTVPNPLPVQVIQDKAETDASKRHENEAREREKSDLVAQYRMANAAEIGLWLLGFTLFFTALAAVFTGLSWRVMRDSSHRELRAYVVVDEAKIASFDSPDDAEVRIVLKNTGVTPAKHVRQRTGRVIRQPDTSEPFPSACVAKNVSTSTIGGGGQFVIPVGLGYNQQVMDAINNESVTLFVFGVVKYEDIFDDTHTLSFRLAYVGPKHAGKNGGMAHCPEGNDMT